MNIGLFFGSFNPIHTGHLIIANVAQQAASMDEVWFVISPQNPFKKNNNLLHEFDRLELVRAAISDDYKFRASDVEFNLPKPSYTVDTLAVLSEKFSDNKFHLIIGSDNLVSFPRWKNYKVILEHYKLIVYPRPGANPADSELIDHPSVKLIDAPEMNISATLIRNMIREGMSVKYMVPDAVEIMIRGKKLFVT